MKKADMGYKNMVFIETTLKTVSFSEKCNVNERFCNILMR